VQGDVDRRDDFIDRDRVVLVDVESGALGDAPVGLKNANADDQLGDGDDAIAITVARKFSGASAGTPTSGLTRN
jgi:hypothetical protein